MMMHDAAMIALIRRQMSHITGRTYRIKLEALDGESLRELVRLMRDVEHEKRVAINHARRMPWR